MTTLITRASRALTGRSLALAALVLFAAPAFAQDKAQKKDAPPPAPAGQQPADQPQGNAPTVKVTRGEGGRTVIKIEGIVVKGTVQKPEAFYILHRSTINYDWDTLKQEFVPKILESVKHSPF
jgi:hypothetical protein